MKNYLFITICTLLISASANAQVSLKRQGSATQIILDGKPMMILGGELSNSAATSVQDIDEVMPRMHKIGLNTVLVPAYWDLIEAEECKFDFTLIDRVITDARKNDLKVIFLWFGAWKNSMSCYAPLWFKQDTKKYPRAMTKTGKPLEIASAFSENVFQADNRAFAKFMQHIAMTDKDYKTVIMIQVENEIGMLEDARDHSAIADKAFNSSVPQQLMSFLNKNKAELHPYMKAKLKDNIKNGTWQQVFGNDICADEIFMSWYYAKYVERLAKTARGIYDIPLYVNAAMNSRGRKPGEYPSAGPLAHLKDIWHCAAPDIDFLSPDIYDTGFAGWAKQYALADNPLFIPESKCCKNSGVRALYAFGEHDAIGYSAFAIDQADYEMTTYLTKSFAMLDNLSPILLKDKGKGLTFGLLFDKDNKERVITDGDVSLTCRHYFTLPWDARAKDGKEWPEGGGIIVRLNKYEYLIAGSGIVVEFKTTSEKQQEEHNTLGEDGFVNAGNNVKSDMNKQMFKGERMGIGYVDQVTVDGNCNLEYIRRENGDQDHQGRHVRISVDEWKILHVKLYKY
ncbi:MAG: DUF5597 domain-containing protein [Prevotella sp.]|nr:DUF5597 domain-containing protein [Prevotella sp.]